MAAVLLLLVYTMCAFGLAYSLGSSKLSLVWRSLLAHLVAAGKKPEASSALRLFGALASFVLVLIECPACTGYWIGVACAQTETAQSVLKAEPFEASLIFGFWTVATNLILARLAGLDTGAEE